jgi:hypothetical protein
MPENQKKAAAGLVIFSMTYSQWEFVGMSFIEFDEATAQKLSWPEENPPKNPPEEAVEPKEILQQ